MRKVLAVLFSIIFIVNLLPSSIFAQTLTTVDDKKISVDKIDLNVYEKAEDSEKILVVIWYEDVDQEKIESMVEEKIGFGRKELVSTLPSISEEEISQLYEANSNSKAKINENILEEYLSETKNVRKKEKDSTDKYISCRREALNQEIKTKTKAIIDETNISDSVYFESSYAPMIIAELSLEEIKEVSKNEKVEEISYVDESVEVVSPSSLLDLESFNDVIGISNIHSNIGLSGDGVKVGIIENSNFVRVTNLPASRCFYLGNVSTADHSTNTALIISGDEGVAPGTNLYSINIDANHLDTYPDSWGDNASMRRYFKCVEDLISEDVDIINSSFGWETTSGYGLVDKWVDYIVENTNTIFIASAGNNKLNKEENKKNPIILSPGKGCNVITVGGCDNKGTSIITDDIMKDFSYDDSTGVEKPDIVAHCNVSGGYPNLTYGGGTSSSAPVVSGTVALMLELRPSLAAYPEAIKAILMASCHYKALPITGDTQETMADGLTDKQGAGVFSPYLAICITAQGNYYAGILSTSDSYENSLFYQPKNGATGMNLSLSWLRTNSAIETENDYSVTVGTKKNLKLSLYKNNSTTSVATSNHTNSSTEMLYYTGLSNSADKYSVEVSTSSGGTYSTPTRFAYAWCLNNEIYQNVDQYEGLYYIKNASNGRYLTYNPTNSTYNLSALSSTNNNQIFVVQLDSLYNILNGYALEGGLTYQDGNILSSDSPSEIGIFNAGEETLHLYTIGDGLYALNASSTSNVQWESSANATNKKWVMEKIAYRLGDVNKDGTINGTDSNIILQYASKLIDLYNNEKFLADVNNDGVIDNQDSLEVLKMAAGL